MSSSSSRSGKIRSSAFYGEYYGHRVEHLQRLLPALRQQSQSLLWTAGDSSLDNKYWFEDRVPAVPGSAYASLLDPPQSKPDVTFWLNHLLATEQPQPTTAAVPAGTPANSSQEQGEVVPPLPKQKWAAINTAVEATTLNERTFRLRPQDIFIRDNIREDDVLIVSVGGNDVALAPTPCTIVSMLCLLHCLPQQLFENGCTCGTVPVDDCCCGCGPSLCSCVCGCPPCLGYFRHLFGTRLEKYLKALTAKTKPTKILVCMIYYPDEAPDTGWASPALKALGYDRNPDKLQALIRKFFTEISSNISVPGTRIIPVALFDALESKNTDDYVARVEPSPEGGRKMAEFLLDHLLRDESSTGGSAFATAGTTSAPPSYFAMQGRD